MSPKFQNLHLEYKVNVRPRYGHGKPAHGILLDKINRNRSLYEEHLKFFLNFKEPIQAIGYKSDQKDENSLVWDNDFLPGLDIVALYGMLARYKPKVYIEIGSGNSTMVARKSISENNLSTEIISIDPYPRANIDHLSDKVIRKPFEDMTDIEFIINSLNENDILFIDNSHRVFPNSDSMVFFLELLPYLKKGVIVHIHDIYLPYDYPQFMCDRFYNEQYMLAAYLIANDDRFKTIMPNYFVSEDEDLNKIIAPIWDLPKLENVEKHGGSYWLQMH